MNSSDKPREDGHVAAARNNSAAPKHGRVNVSGAQPAHPDAQAHAAGDAAAADNPSRRPRTWMWVAIIATIALLLATGVAGWALGHWQAQRNAQSEQAAELIGPGSKLTSLDDVPRRVEGDPFAVGPVDAPVVISEFSDFECPFCAKFVNETEGRLLEQYVDTGKVRIEWNDLPVNGPASHLAAQAGRAAGAQERFWEFHHELFADSEGLEGHPDNSLDDLVGLAEKAGVPDLDRFREDLEDERFGPTVDRALAFGMMLGARATPTFLVGDQVIAGAQPFEQFEKVIEAQLAGESAPAEHPAPGEQPAPGERPAPGEQPAPGGHPAPGAHPVPGERPAPGEQPALGGHPAPAGVPEAG